MHINPAKTISYWAESAGIQQDEIKNNFPFDIHHEYERGNISDHDFYLHLTEALGLNKLEEKNFWSGWRKLLEDKTNTWDELQRIFPRTPKWLLSNTNPQHILGDLVNKHSFFNEIAGAVYSYEVHSRKPEPEIFLKACNMAGCSPDEALFIDDMNENIQAAEKLGFKTVHYTDHSVFIDEISRLALNLD